MLVVPSAEYEYCKGNNIQDNRLDNYVIEKLPIVRDSIIENIFHKTIEKI